MDLFHQSITARPDEAQERMNRMAHRITRTGPVKVSGQHLSEAPNEPFAFTEAELLAGDLERMNRREQRFRERLAVVHEMELAALRRAGWL